MSRRQGWDRRFIELLRFRMTHGHSSPVPQTHGALGQWASTQRHLAAGGSLRPNRSLKLRNMGFNLDPHGDSWQERLCQLLLYRQMRGDCNPLQTAPGRDGALGRWVGQQRHLYHSGALRPGRIARLASAGFIFSKAELDW